MSNFSSLSVFRNVLCFQNIFLSRCLIFENTTTTLVLLFLCSAFVCLVDSVISPSLSVQFTKIYSNMTDGEKDGNDSSDDGNDD